MWELIQYEILLRTIYILCINNKKYLQNYEMLMYEAAVAQFQTFVAPLSAKVEEYRSRKQETSLRYIFR